MSASPRAAAIWQRAPRLLLVLLTAAAFANAVPNGFVWIDHWQVESGGLIARTWSQFWQLVDEPLGAMPDWEGVAPYARPLVILVFSLVHGIAAAQPFAYHLTLVLLHIANVLLVYGVLCDFEIEPTIAVVVGALFAVHPLQTAAVSWISGIADPLFTLFVLVALRCQLAASAATRWTVLLRFSALFSFLIALGAKETAIIFPFLLVAAYALFPHTLAAGASRRGATRAVAVARAVTPFFVILVVDLLYRGVVLQGHAFGAGFAALPLSVRLLTAPRLILSYLTLPLRFGALTVCDDYALSAQWDMQTMWATVALLAVLIGLVRYGRQAPQAVFGVLWMFLGLLPALSIVPILHYRADRFFYFPLIGWSLTVVTVFHTVIARWRIAPRMWRGAGLAVTATLLALVGQTVRRNGLFSDDITLFKATVVVSPLCREAHTTLGDAYLRSGRSAEAVAEYEHARRATPGHVSYAVTSKILINLGLAQLARNDFAAAELAFDEAHRLQPALLHPLFGLGAANLGLGHLPAAVAWLEQAYAIDPNNPDVVFNLALGCDRLGRRADAASRYEHYLAIAPRGRARPLAEERLRALGNRPEP